MQYHSACSYFNYPKEKLTREYITAHKNYTVSFEVYARCNHEEPQASIASEPVSVSTLMINDVDPNAFSFVAVHRMLHLA